MPGNLRKATLWVEAFDESSHRACIIVERHSHGRIESKGEAFLLRLVGKTDVAAEEVERVGLSHSLQIREHDVGSRVGLLHMRYKS